MHLRAQLSLPMMQPIYISGRTDCALSAVVLTYDSLSSSTAPGLRCRSLSTCKPASLELRVSLAQHHLLQPQAQLVAPAWVSLIDSTHTMSNDTSTGMHLRGEGCEPN